MDSIVGVDRPRLSIAHSSIQSAREFSPCSGDT